MSEQTWLTRVTPNQAAFSYWDWVAQGGLDPYRQHQLLWKLFDLSPKLPNAPAPFLFRSSNMSAYRAFLCFHTWSRWITAGNG